MSNMQKATFKMKVSELDDDFIHELKDDFGQGAEVEIKVFPAGSQSNMNEDVFWKIIELADWSQSDTDAIVEPIIEALTQLSVRQLYEFQDIFSEKLCLLDGEKYAKNIGELSYHKDQPFSVDHFLDVRACVVANGREYFEHVLKTPEDMPKDKFFESLIYIVSKAYFRKTGKEFSYLPPYDIQTFSNKNGWK